MKIIRALGCLLVYTILTTACSASDEMSGSAPFDAVLIDLFGTDDTGKYLADTKQAAAEIVATCMRDAGFEFRLSPTIETLDPPQRMDIEAARTDGFGIVAGFRFQLSQFDLDPVQLDPNERYLRTLSSAEFSRFFFTLDGAKPEPGQRSEGGCNTQASEEAYADWLRFSEALPNFTAMGEERDTHPDWLAARSEWRRCMLDRGFDYAEPDAIRTDVISRMRDTVNEVYPGGQLPVIEVAGTPTVDAQVDALLDELAQFERAAAVATIACTEPVADQFDAVERLVQQAFVERNQATIDELLAATG